MQYMKTDFSQVAYAEEQVHMKHFFEMIETCEKLLFEKGVYKSGPTVVETKLSTFGKPEEALFKLYIPLNIPIEEEGGYKYIKHFTIADALSEIIPFDDQLFPTLDKMKERIEQEQLEIIDDTLYLIILPIFGRTFVDLQIPVKEV